MNVWDIILICLMTAAALWLVVSSVITLVKAKRAGVIRIKFPANITPFVYMAICAALNITAAVGSAVELHKIKKEMDDLQRLGFVDFHMEYYNWGLEYPFSPETEKAVQRIPRKIQTLFMTE